MAQNFTFLVVDCPMEPTQTIIWDTIEIAVGRVAEQDLVVPDSEVSRKHALFRMEGDAHTLADLHTSNGTFVNGSQIRTHTLRPGDVIEIGPATLRFHQEPESPMRGGENVRFASQLKGFPEMPGGEGGKTVLGLAPESELDDGLDLGEDLSHLGPVDELQFELGGDLLEAPPMPGMAAKAQDSVPEIVPPILEVEGFAEDDDGFGDDLTEAALAELEKEEPPAIDAPAMAPPAVPPSVPRPPAVEVAAPPVRTAPVVEPAPARQPVATAAPVRGDVAESAPTSTVSTRAATIQLQVELEGPRDALREVVAALLEQEISIPPLKVRLRRPPKS